MYIGLFRCVQVSVYCEKVSFQVCFRMYRSLCETEKLTITLNILKIFPLFSVAQYRHNLGSVGLFLLCVGLFSGLFSYVQVSLRDREAHHIDGYSIYLSPFLCSAIEKGITCGAQVSFRVYQLFYCVQIFFAVCIHVCSCAQMSSIVYGFDQQAPSNCRSLLQNIVSFIGLFYNRDL